MRTSLSQNSDGESCTGGLPDPLPPAPLSLLPGVLPPPSLLGAPLPLSAVALTSAAVSFAPAVSAR